MPNIPTIRQGKKACDVYILSSRIVRAELCDTQEGEMIYARGYRPQRWFDALVEERVERPDVLVAGVGMLEEGSYA